MSKFSLKAAAVAAALVVSGAASAATSGDLYIVVSDGANDTFVADVGPVVSTTPASATTIDLSTLAGWSTFVADAGASLSSSQFLLVGGAARKGDISYSVDPTTAPTASQLNTIFGLNTTSVLTSALGAATSADILGSAPGSASNIGFTTGFGALATSGILPGAIGSTVDLEYFTTTGTAGNFTLATTVNLASTGTLTINGAASPTPEPGTYALMAAGLLAVGAIVRRRARG